MKKIITTSLAVVIGGLSFMYLNIGNPIGSPLLLKGQEKSLTLKVVEKEGEKQIPYNLKVGGYSHHFWHPDQLEQFATENNKLRFDLSDDEQTSLVRQIIHEELKTKSAETILEELKNEKTYTVNNSMEVSLLRKVVRTVYAAAPRYSNPLPGSGFIGNSDPGSATSFSIDSALVYGTSGDSIGISHLVRRSQTNDNILLDVYCTAATGTPTSYTAYIYNSPPTGSGEDPDRPDTGGTAQYTSDVVDFSSCGTPGWKTFTFTGVDTTVSQHIWFLIGNTTASPNLNFADIQIRGALDATLGQTGTGTILWNHQAFSNTTGWTADGTSGGSIAPMIVTYANNDSYGNSYVTAETHATDTAYRGGRFTPTEDLQSVAFGTLIGDGSLNMMLVAQGSATTTADTSIDENQEQRGPNMTYDSITLAGGTAYDFLLKSGTADNFGPIYTMGNSPPSTVAATASPFTYVTGNTLGSLTEDTTKTYGVFVWIADNPAISGGGGTDILGNVIQ